MASIKIDTKAIDNFNKKLEELNINYSNVVGKSLYNGVGIVADEVRKEIQGLKVEARRGTEENKLTGVTVVQKKGLLDGLGISSLRETGKDLTIKIGFDGYNNTKTKKFPKGQPNALIARSLVSGTFFRAKNNFIQRAVRKSKKDALKKIEEDYQKQIKEIIER